MKHIGRAGQLMHYRLAFRCSAVHREAEFAPVKLMGDVLAPVVIRVVATGGPLNANHPGPQIGQQPGGERTGPPDGGVEHREWSPLGTERLPCGPSEVSVDRCLTRWPPLCMSSCTPSASPRPCGARRNAHGGRRADRTGLPGIRSLTRFIAIAIAIAVEKVARLELRVREKVQCCHHLRRHHPRSLQQARRCHRRPSI